jgi:glutathione S-transferase
VKIVIGNKNYSSWSLRPWLMLKHVGVPFEEEVIPFEQADTAQRIAKHSPSGRVPVVIDETPNGPLTVWDSIAIGEYLNEKFPQAKLWPEDAAARAVARSVSAEMHSGFSDLRNDLSMRLRSTYAPRKLRAETQGNIDRIQRIWGDCRARFGEKPRAGKPGPFLFGAFSIADAMYAPMVSRFRTYAVPMDPTCAAYAKAAWELPAMQEWLAAAQKETYPAPEHERDAPAL